MNYKNTAKVIAILLSLLSVSGCDKGSGSSSTKAKSSNIDYTFQTPYDFPYDPAPGFYSCAVTTISINGPLNNKPVRVRIIIKCGDHIVRDTVFDGAALEYYDDNKFEYIVAENISADDISYGDATTMFIIDPDNTINESNESNNTLQVPMVWGGNAPG